MKPIAMRSWLSGLPILALVAACSSESDVSGTAGTGGQANDGSAAAGSGGGGSSGMSGRSATGGGVAKDAGPACIPTLTGWTTTFVPPGPIYRGVCTAAQVDDVATVCSDGQASTPCPPSNPDACSECLVSHDNAAQYGAFVRFTTPAIVQTNPGGCIAGLLGDTSSTGCGAKVQAISLCQIEACKHCPNLSSFGACHAMAGTDPNTCKSTLTPPSRASALSIPPYKRLARPIVRWCSRAA
jgi:hypothetical protein